MTDEKDIDALFDSKKKGPELNSLGIEVHESNYKLESDRSMLSKVKNMAGKNPILTMNLFLIFLLLLYTVLITYRISIFHYMALAVTSFFMLWISLADDARVVYKFFSTLAIFLSMVLFLSF